MVAVEIAAVVAIVVQKATMVIVVVLVVMKIVKLQERIHSRFHRFWEHDRKNEEKIFVVLLSMLCCILLTIELKSLPQTNAFFMCLLKYHLLMVHDGCFIYLFQFMSSYLYVLFDLILVQFSLV